MPKTLKFLFAIVLIAGVIAVVGYSAFSNWYYSGISSSADTDSTPVTFEIKPGQSPTVVGNNLIAAGLITDINVYTLYLRFNNQGDEFKAGKFSLAKNASIIEIVDSISAVQKIDVAKVTLLEGWKAKQMGVKLEEAFKGKPKAVFTSAEFDSLTTNPDKVEFRADVKAFLNEHKPAGKSLEGFLYPDTYEFEFDASTKTVVETLLRQFSKKLSAETLGDNFYQDLVLASIIERESFTNSERPIIASVFKNRLKIKMPLQSDATVNYATGKSEPQPSIEDTKINSPYNTYKNIGLPPTPISNPRLESITAAMRPSETDYYYFIHEQDGSGQVHFAKTFGEHSANIRKYLNN